MTYCVTDDYSLFCRFPPGVGAIGTAALLNVPKSLEQILTTLKESGYDVGGLPSPVDGEAIVTYLKEISKENILSRGADYIKNCLLYTSPSPRDPKTTRMPSSA